MLSALFRPAHLGWVRLSALSVILATAPAACDGGSSSSGAKCDANTIYELKRTWCVIAFQCQASFALTSEEFAARYGKDSGDCIQNHLVPLVEAVIASVVVGDAGAPGGDSGAADAAAPATDAGQNDGGLVVDAGTDGPVIIPVPHPPVEDGRWEAANVILQRTPAFFSCIETVGHAACGDLASDAPLAPGGGCTADVLNGKVPPPKTYTCEAKSLIR